MTSRFDFTGTTVAVTGAGHGFGRAIAQSFAGFGARVFGTDLSDAELAETAAAPGSIATRAFDLTAKGAANVLTVAAFVDHCRAHVTEFSIPGMALPEPGGLGPAGA